MTDDSDPLHRKPTVEGTIRTSSLRRPPGYRAVSRGPTGLHSPGYLVGPEAVTVAQLTGLSLSSLAYRTGNEVSLDPTDLRYAETEKLCLDISRLDWWDKWRVLWSRLGGHYYLLVSGD